MQNPTRKMSIVDLVKLLYPIVSWLARYFPMVCRGWWFATHLRNPSLARNVWPLVHSAGCEDVFRLLRPSLCPGRHSDSDDCGCWLRPGLGPGRHSDSDDCWLWAAGCHAHSLSRKHGGSLAGKYL